MVYKDLGAWWEEGGKCKKKGSFQWSKSRWAKDLVLLLCIIRIEFIISDQAGPKDCLTYFLFPEFWSYIVYIDIIYKNNETWKAQNFELFYILKLICTRCRTCRVNLKLNWVHRIAHFFIVWSWQIIKGFELFQECVLRRQVVDSSVHRTLFNTDHCIIVNRHRS